MAFSVVAFYCHPNHLHRLMNKVDTLITYWDGKRNRYQYVYIVDHFQINGNSMRKIPFLLRRNQFLLHVFWYWSYLLCYFSFQENPSEYEQQIGARNPLLPSIIEKNRQLPAAPVYPGSNNNNQLFLMELRIPHLIFITVFKIVISFDYKFYDHFFLNIIYLGAALPVPGSLYPGDFFLLSNYYE